MKFTFQFILVAFCLVFMSNQVTAQDTKAAYEEAKRHFKVADYSSAMLAFSSLTDDVTYGNYATFYYGLSAYNKKRYQTAKDAWKQILTKNPNWKQANEVNYWLSETALKTKNADDFFKYSKNLDESWKCQKVNDLYGSAKYSEIENLYKQYTEKCVARLLFNKIALQSLSQRNQKLLAELNTKYDLKLKESSEAFPLVKKDKYAIAVLFPFMYEADDLGSAMANSVILDTYQGMQLAQKQLDNEGIYVNLFPYDTRKSTFETQQIINGEKLQNADVIVGPLYDEPFRLVDEYSKNNRIPLVNPITSKNSFITDNPYSLLFQASYATQGTEAAKYAKKHYSENKDVMIFYEKLKDRILAESYKEELEKDSFNVVKFEQVDRESARNFQRKYTNTYKSQNDNGGSGVATEQADNFIEKEVPGHFLVATSDNTIANSFVSVIETRDDAKIGLIGTGNWLKFKLLSFEQFQRLDIRLVASEYFDERTSEYKDFKKIVIDTYKIDPSEFHLVGYEAMMQIGRMLKKNGKYFQRRMGEKEPEIKGILMNNLLYNGAKDNQLVPILKLENFEVVNDNKE